MPTGKRNWCAHPRHLETHPNGKKMFTKFGPKPNHPLGSRRISSDLCNHINKMCLAIRNDSSLQLNENNWLCTKCYEFELNQLETNICVKLRVDMENFHFDDYAGEISGKEDVENSPNLIEERRDFCVKKLNEIFKLFHLEPVIP